MDLCRASPGDGTPRDMLRHLSLCVLLLESDLETMDHRMERTQALEHDTPELNPVPTSHWRNTLQYILEALKASVVFFGKSEYY